MNRTEKEKKILNVMGNVTLCRLLEYCRNNGWNMVVSNEGKIMFNKAGTPNAVGSYKEGYWNIDFDHLSLQEKKTVDFVYSLCK